MFSPPYQSSDGLQGCTNPCAWNYDPLAEWDDGTCETCAEKGFCDPYDTDGASNCTPGNEAWNGYCCDGYCETADDCDPTFRGGFTAANGRTYPSCFGETSGC
jgi:hypothetical protein